jgi:Rrf2 family protein
MRLSTKGRYAVRAMLDLALFHERGPVNLQSIAERQQVSPDYLEQILRRLRGAGLVRSVRGPHGGFALTKAPEDVSIWDVVSALEEPIAPAPCVRVRGGQRDECARVPTCAAHLLWRELAAHIEAFLHKRTLRDLCEEARKLCVQGTPKHKHMFHI